MLRVLFVFLSLNVVSLKAFALDSTVMSGLQQILTTENEQRTKLDKSLVEAMEEMRSTPVNASQLGILDTTLLRDETRISDIKLKLIENHLRIEFLNSFISSMENSKDARVDAPKILAEMAHKEILESVETNSDQKTWVFEMYLSVAIKEIMEPSEKFTEFVKGFMEYSSLRDPRNPGEFSKSRNYIGGTPSQKNTNPTED